MSREDWYRNVDWNDGIAATFEERLSRARHKSDYLRIQASSLTDRHPRVALALLDRYFALGEHFDHAQAYVDRAKAYLALGDVNLAIEAYEAALAREATYPQMKTCAYSDLPYLIATLGLESHFDRALEVLELSSGRLMFPVDRFKHHATRAIILARRHSPECRAQALAALEAATIDHSGFQYHPNIGLLSEKHALSLSLLAEIVGLH